MKNIKMQRVTASNAYFLLVIVIILIAAASVRASAIGVSGFWLDEMFGANYINLNPFELIVAVLRFDVQPPLYYLQLKLWGIPSHSDAWLLTNSIAWSLGTLISATYGAYKFSGKKAAMLTALLTSFLGSEIYFSSELRMYSMLTCLAVIGWIRAEYWAQESSRKNSIWLVAILAMIASTHSAGVVLITSILLYGLTKIALNNGITAAIRSWKTPFFTGIFLAPWLINASFRSVSQTTLPSIHIIANTISGWLLGYGGIEFPLGFKLAIAAIIILTILAGIIFGDNQERLLLCCFIIFPLLFVALVSLALRPIWISRLFSFCAPFLSLFYSILLSRIIFTPTRQKSIQTLFKLVIFLASSALAVLGWNQNHTPWKMQYRSAAHFIAQHNIQKQPIYIPDHTTFWGIARYLVGPNWGSILKVQDPLKPDHSVTWRKIYARLGKTWLKRLGLLPKTRELKTKSGTMWIGYSPLPNKVADAGFWLVGDNTLLSSTNNCRHNEQIGLERFRGVVIVHCGPTTRYKP